MLWGKDSNLHRAVSHGTEKRAGGQPLGAEASYATFIPDSLPPRQEGMAAKVSSPHIVDRKTLDSRLVIHHPQLSGLFKKNLFFCRALALPLFCWTVTNLMAFHFLCNIFKENLLFFYFYQNNGLFGDQFTILQQFFPAFFAILSTRFCWSCRLRFAFQGRTTSFFLRHWQKNLHFRVHLNFHQWASGDKFYCVRH